MPLYWDEKTLLLKTETSYGVDATPTGAANAILATDVRLSPMEGQDVDRALEMPWMGASGTIPTGLHAKLSFKVELKGSGTAGSAPAFGGGVSLMDGRVYATTGFGVVVAFDAATGAEIWRIRLPTPLRAAPSVDAGRLFVTSQDGQLTALNADTGEQLWQANATVEPASILGPGSPAVALDTDIHT